MTEISMEIRCCNVNAPSYGGGVTFDHVVCMAYYIADPNDIAAKSSARRTKEQKRDIMLKSLQKLGEDPAIKNALFVVLDDASPFKIPHEDILDRIGGRPGCSIRLETNAGCAKKENVFNAVAVEFAKNLIRVDSDVVFQDSFSHVLSGLGVVENVGILTINCDVLAYYALKESAEDSSLIPKQWGTFGYPPPICSRRYP